MLSVLSRSHPFLSSVPPALKQVRRFGIWPPEVYRIHGPEQATTTPVEKTAEKTAQVFKQSVPQEKPDQKSEGGFLAIPVVRQDFQSSALEVFEDL